VTVVHGWHQGVIEDIDVKMHPESCKVRLGNRSHRLLQSMTGAPGPEFEKVNDRDGGAPDMLADEMVVIAEDPVADESDVLVSHQRLQPAEVGERVRAPSLPLARSSVWLC
jgi:hypothetical protein